MSDFPMTIERPNQEPLVLDNVESAIAWTQAEKDFWAWTQQINYQHAGYGDTSRRDEWLNQVKNANNHLKLSTTEKGNASLVPGARSALINYCERDLSSSSPRAQYVNGMRTQPNGDIMAAAALCAYFGENTLPKPSSQPPHLRYFSLRGQTAMALYDAMLPRDAMEQASVAINRMSDANLKARQEFLQKASDAFASFNSRIEEMNREFAENVDAHAASIDEEIRRVNLAKDDLVKQCNETRDFYTSAMEVQAPVEYWKGKGVRHKKAAKWWGFALLFYAIFGTLLLAGLFYGAYTHAYELASTGENKFSHLLLLISAAIAAATTILFWVGRFLQRLYLSERHMAIDAKLREVMAMTYLALSAKQQVDEKDRALVLAPLFRAGTDGIIQEDTGLDSAMAMLARALENPKR